MMAKPDVFMPLYIGDYLRDTLHLNTEEHGAYLLLLMAAWGKGGSLTDDDEKLHAIAKLTHARWLEVRLTIQDFFDIRDGKWFHKRVKEERNKALSQIELRSQAGKKAAAARWRTQCDGNADAMQTQCLSPSPSTLESKSESESKSKEKTYVLSEAESTSISNKQKHLYPIEFETFWKAYPVKRGKGAAVKAWRKALKTGATNKELIAAVELSKNKSPEWLKGFVQHPTTWLNQRGWENEFTEEGNNGTPFKSSAPGKWTGIDKKDYREGIGKDGQILPKSEW